ncbi:thioesterase family protein [soil metagenome]
MSVPEPLTTDLVRTLLEDLIPFNRFLGLKLEQFSLAPARLVTKLELRPDYVGNPRRNAPHGGVVSFVVDATAGVAVALSLGDPNLASGVATIDMRVDYLQPARGHTLLTTSEVVHGGNRIVAVRSEVHDDAGALVALGSNVFNVARGGR